MCLSTSTVLFFLPNKHLTFFTTFLLWKFFSAKLRGQGLVIDHWSCCCSVQLFATPGLQHAYPSLSPRVCSDYVHWVDDAIQPSYPLFAPSPPALNLSQHQGSFLVVRIWCSHCWDLTSISGREPKSCFKLLQAGATQDQSGWFFVYEDMTSFFLSKDSGRRAGEVMKLE